MDRKRALCGGCWFLANVFALAAVPMALGAAALAGGSEWSLQSWALLFGAGAALALLVVLVGVARRLERAP